MKSDDRVLVKIDSVLKNEVQLIARDRGFFLGPFMDRLMRLGLAQWREDERRKKDDLHVL